jgi:ATP-dependent exoDNAse (exonuclease V) beta subunit
MPTLERAPDQDARDRIVEALDETLFVEAGAGSGKTSTLVARVVALVLAGEEIGAIAAITFTEKAASELRDRVRMALTERAATTLDPGERARIETALDELDAAAIGTLHAFAHRLLREHAVAAGLPPRVEVLDEIASQLAFEERWTDARATALDDPARAALLLDLAALGVRFDHLRQVALAFEANWDLVEGHPPPPPSAPCGQFDPSAILDELEAVCAERHLGPEDCKLVDELSEVEAWIATVRAATTPAERLELCRERRFRFHLGRTPAWAVCYRHGRFADLAALRAHLRQLAQRLEAAIDVSRQTCLQHVAGWLADFTRAGAEQRRAEGRLHFHDLLVLARRMLNDDARGAEVRSLLRQRYRRLLLDEFQDTDPIQVELAVRLAAPPGARVTDWEATQVEPGRLFFVGDPKQSIYRFRRADIGLFLAAASRFGREPVELTANFRTTAPVVEWVNATFSRLITPEPDSQPAYLGLTPTRAGAGGPGVVQLGSTPHADNPTADELREREAAEVAAAVRTAVVDGWPVEDPPGSGEWRPARLADVAVLIPTRLCLAALERALAAEGIPSRAEASSLVYVTDEVRELLLTLRAVVDPSDHGAVLAALRSRVFGCSDADLVDWRVRRRRSWNHQAPPPEEAPLLDDPVGDAMAELARWHRQAAWWTPAELLDDIVRRRALLEQAIDGDRAADSWRRLRFVIDQARAWSDAGGAGLHAYLDWARRHQDETSRVAEAVLPETDVDAVRILTIHAAKGLEFPITIVAGTTARPSGRSGPQVVFPPGAPPAIHLGASNTSEAFQAYQPVDEQMSSHERMRLLYVACTRARDHLVVSLHRKEDLTELSPKATLAQALAFACPPGPSLTAAAGHLPPAPRAPVPDWPLRDEVAWAAARDRALAVGGRPGTVAATTLAKDAFPPTVVDAGIEKGAADLDLPPWNKGRYGTAVGRAVHAVLQTVDLTTGAGLEDAAAAQAAAEGLLGQEDLVAALARSALAAPVVREAAAAPHWREVYVAAPLAPDAPLLEGYVDLLFRSSAGLVVVDHKTDHAATDADLDAKVARYRLQGAAYAAALEAVTGEPVVRCVFVFCSPEGAREREVDDLASARADVLARLAAGGAG